MKRFWSVLTPRLLLLVVVVVPMLLASVYYLFLAQERYVSTSVLTVRRAHQESMVPGGLAMLLAGGAGGSLEDTRYLRDYIHSLGLMKKLDATLHLRDHYAAAPMDPFFRLWPQASQEWMLTYWRSRVEITLDELSGLLTVRVEAFDAATAQRINRALLDESEAFVNSISQRIAQDQLGFARGELDRASERLDVARSKLLRFQSENQVLDPMAQAQATGVLTADLRGHLAKAEAELTTKRAYLQDDAPDVVLLRNQIAALRLQVGRESRGATQADSGSLNQLAVKFHELKARASFTEDAYKSSLVAVENIRLEAARKVKSVVVIEPPTLAELAEHPRRFYSLATVLIVSLMLLALARLVVATINEHRD